MLWRILVGRIVYLPLDSTDRATVVPVNGEMSVLTPANAASRRIMKVKDKQSGTEYDIDAPYVMTEYTVTSTSEQTLFGPFVSDSLVRLKDLFDVRIGGVKQLSSDFILCDASGTALTNEKTAKYIKFSAGVPAGVTVVICYPAKMTFGTLA